MRSENKVFEPNNCSLWRWALVIIISIAVQLVFFVVVLPLSEIVEVVYGPEAAGVAKLAATLISYDFAFIAAVISIKTICHTPIRDFVHGVGGSTNFKDILVIAALFLVGLAISLIVFPVNASLNSINPRLVVISVVISLLLTWMQTSLEEILFRGIVIRYVGNNECKISSKMIISGVLSSVVFMSLHMNNPEVTSQTDIIDKIYMGLMYFSAGAALFLTDLLYGDLTPGLIIHAINNFIGFAIISEANYVGGTNSIFVSHDITDARTTFFNILIIYMPLIVFLTVRKYKGKDV